ncbi:hypothetical protein BLSTO_00632 [Blastocystis sp. subtype 1]
MVAILESTPPVTEALYVRCYGKGSSLGSGIPEGDWFCERCKEGQQNAKCILCGKTGGAMKHTTDYQWAHINCALWIPEGEGDGMA